MGLFISKECTVLVLHRHSAGGGQMRGHLLSRHAADSEATHILSIGVSRAEEEGSVWLLRRGGSMD